MKVKIFQAFGKEEIDRLEGEINAWIEAQSARTTWVETQSSVAGVGEGGGEMYQTLVVCIWYYEG